MIATGIQAIGLMGRRICITGLTTWLAAGYQPSVKPKRNAHHGRQPEPDRHAPQRIANIAPTARCLCSELGDPFLHV